jgi:hypothetical protein
MAFLSVLGLVNVRKWSKIVQKRSNKVQKWSKIGIINIYKK